MSHRDGYESCGLCVYWAFESEGDPENANEVWDCRRFAPTRSDKEGLAVWPRTSFHQFCGQFELDKDREEKLSGRSALGISGPDDFVGGGFPSDSEPTGF